MPEAWSYKKPSETPKSEIPKSETETTPGFDFKFDIEHEGKTRKAEMSAGGLYVFTETEVFDKPAPSANSDPDPPCLFVARAATGETRRVRIRGMRNILELTKKT